jgi:flagellar basal body-associated protein FliL
MADEEEKPEEGQGAEGEGGEKASAKGSLKLVGAIFVLIALGGAAALMSIPSKEEKPRFQGPFHFSLFEEKFSSNTKDNNQRRFLQALLDCMYFSYEEGYLAARTADPLYTPILRDTVGRVISDKTLDEAASGPAREAFLAELRDVLDPILFPAHIGATALPLERDVGSGLRPGISFRRSTFRGRFHDHVLHVDGQAKTLQIDEGPTTSFDGHEEDVGVVSDSGDVLYVDVSELFEDFQGDVRLGVHGRIRQVFASDLIAQ